MEYTKCLVLTFLSQASDGGLFVSVESPGNLVSLLFVELFFMVKVLDRIFRNGLFNCQVSSLHQAFDWVWHV